jgi:hypothetical protein
VERAVGWSDEVRVRMKEKKEEEARVSNTLHEGSQRELNVIKMRKIAEKRKGI